MLSVWKTENPKQQSVFFKVYPKERSERLLSKDSVGFMTTISSHFGFLTPSPLMGVYERGHRLHFSLRT
jgi:hypothetical protein